MAKSNMIIFLLAMAAISLRLLNVSVELPAANINCQQYDEIFGCNEDRFNVETNTLVTFFIVHVRLGLDGLRSLLERAASKLVEYNCNQKERRMKENTTEYYTIRLDSISGEMENYFLL